MNIYETNISDVIMVDNKSLKFYIGRFRNYEGFHEDCANPIMKDLIELRDFRYIEVWAKWSCSNSCVNIEIKISRYRNLLRFPLSAKNKHHSSLVNANFFR